ncbi:MAG: metal ABC transporter permease [Marinilabiliales bacterium]|nr:MAG: metal ABC transporter permease [Marinilabiliales bacterium]
MAESFFELLQYRFFTNALLASVLTSINCGIIGTYIVSRRLVFISGGITHASFGGIGIGYFFGFNPVLAATVFAVLSALGIEFLSKKADVREDSLIGIFWSFGMALGIIFIFLAPGYAPNLMGYLFGSLLTVSPADIWMMLALTLTVSIFFIVFYKVILFISFDQEYARTHRAPVQLVNYLLISLVAATIVLSIKVAGIILVISLLTIPQTIANLFTRKFSKIMVASVLIAFMGTFTGLMISYSYNIPSGASVIMSLIFAFIITKLFSIILTSLKVKTSYRNKPAETN